MKRFYIWFFACLMIFGSASSSFASVRKKEKAKTEQKSDTLKKKDICSKLFTDKKKHIVKKGIITVHQYNDKLYLEVPTRLMKHDFLLSSVITNASDYSFSGMEAADGRTIQIDKTDSLVLFCDPHYNVRYNEQDNNQKQAFALSHNSAIYKSFPIEGYTADSTAVVFEVTSFFKSSNKDILDLSGHSYGGMLSIVSASPDSKTSFIDTIDAYSNCISITQNCSAKLTVSVMGYVSTEHPEVTMSLQTTLAMLPEKKMQTREANARIGSGYIAYSDFRPANGEKRGYYATRRDLSLQQPIVFYVDTLIQSSWIKAIQKSADGWNTVFESAGLGKPIVLKPYSKDSAFIASDPMVNTISFLNNNKSSVTAYNQTDLRTGQILSTKIGVPRDFAFLVRRNGVYQMAEVDPRYRTYYIPDDAICESLTAYLLKAFGIGLGLKTNLAGSAAYSPAELRSPQFTQKNGITASVMDVMPYNYLAQPGDKEKGVVLVADRPGICDAQAIKYLYSPIKGDESATLKSWAMEHDGDPRYFFGKQMPNAVSDPRCQSNDLGNDPVASIDALVSHVKYVVKNSPSWFHDDNIPSDYRQLFPDFVVIELFQKLLPSASSYIGGIYINEADAKSKVPSYKSVPADLQKKVLNKIYSAFGDFSWLDTNPEFLQLGGANTNMSSFLYNNGIPTSTVMARVSRMGLSVDKSASPYTQEACLTDIEKILFAETIKGQPLKDGSIPQIASYIGRLKAMSPTLTAIEKAKMKGSSSSFNFRGDDLSTMLQGLTTHDSLTDRAGVEPLSAINFYSSPDVEAVCYDKLKSARRYLTRALSLARNEIDRGKCSFLIMTIDRVMK
jgi:hypothetical protein